MSMRFLLPVGLFKSLFFLFLIGYSDINKGFHGIPLFSKAFKKQVKDFFWDTMWGSVFSTGLCPISLHYFYIWANLTKKHKDWHIKLRLSFTVLRKHIGFVSDLHERVG